MGAAYFYHLTRQPLEATLPLLLGKALGAGWRVVVRGQAEDRMDWLDAKLWLGHEDGFLPHGRAGRAHEGDQPILLSTSDALPNAAACVMCIDGADITPTQVNALERTCILFDGHDDQAVQTARNQWKILSDAGCAAQYWSEESGRWEKKAES